MTPEEELRKAQVNKNLAKVDGSLAHGGLWAIDVYPDQVALTFQDGYVENYQIDRHISVAMHS